MIFLRLTKLPAGNPTNPKTKRNKFIKRTNFPDGFVVNSPQYVRVCITGGAINANVEELIEPTKLMNKSSFGIAAASANVSKTVEYLSMYSDVKYHLSEI